MKKAFLLIFALLSLETLPANPNLKISGGSTHPLIHSGIGKHRLNISYDTGQNGSDAAIGIVIKKYGEEHIIYKETRKVQQQSGAMSAEINFPEIGFYDFQVTMTTGSTTICEVKNVAVVPECTERVGDMGVCTHFAQGKGAVPYSLELIATAGFSSIRDEIYWGDVEREEGVFSFHRKYDDYIDAAVEAGIEPLIALGYGNPRGEPTVERGFPTDGHGRKRFARYTRELVERYGDQVPYWELWNEPSPQNGVDPVKIYLPLLREVYATIKDIKPEAEVISSAGSPNHVDGAFIRPILDAGGADFMDGFAMHTYVAPYTPETGYETRGSRYFSRAAVPTMWTEYGNISGRYSKGKELGVWITEMGWHNAENLPWNGDADTVNIDDKRQAAYATRLFLLSRRYGTVRKTYLYDFQNDGTDPAEREDNFGIITMDFTPKAAYQAIAVMSAVIGNRKFSEALIDSDAVKAYAYGRQDDRVVAVWSVNDYDAPLSDRTETTITLSPDVKKITHMDWQGRETVLRSKKGIFRIPVSENPSYIILM